MSIIKWFDSNATHCKCKLTNQKTRDIMAALGKPMSNGKYPLPERLTTVVIRQPRPHHFQCAACGQQFTLTQMQAPFDPEPGWKD